jgi:putative colanic acid biosynthesis acetyltransferase WcaF
MWKAILAFNKWFPIPIKGWMSFILKLFGAKIGKNVYISRTVTVKIPFNLVVDNNSFINPETFIDSLASVKIGKNVVIAPRVMIMSGSHRPFDPKFTTIAKPIIIEDGVWIGCNTVILGGVTIHKGAVIGAMSLVNKDVPPLTKVGGVPAKILEKNGNLNW